jgi:hypothetical protein
MHVPIHGPDICRRLGIKRELPEARLAPLADLVDVRIFGAKQRMAGCKHTAPISTGLTGTDLR